MDDFYLNDTTRKFYLDALEHIRNCGHEVWGLDAGLGEYLDRINSSPNVRTMYSKRDDGTSFGHRKDSYLTICYTIEVEPKILVDIESKLKAIFPEKRFRNYYHCKRES